MARSFPSSRRAAQLPLPRTGGWGGRRPGAGRKRLAPRPQVPHRTRPPHRAVEPLHLTWRCVAGLPSLRGLEIFPVVAAAFGRQRAARADFRVVHFSVQDDHLHLLVEAHDRLALRAGARGLAIRLARAVNRALGRRGRVFGDRYHARPLRTPREVRAALAYLLGNVHKHQGPRLGSEPVAWLDPCSSAPTFDGWRGLAPATPSAWVHPARTWLARVGWRRHGLLPLGGGPAPPRGRPRGC